MNLFDQTAAEQIIDIVRAAHTSRDQAVALVATKLSNAWADGFSAAHKSTVEAFSRKEFAKDDWVQADYAEQPDGSNYINNGE